MLNLRTVEEVYGCSDGKGAVYLVCVVEIMTQQKKASYLD